MRRLLLVVFSYSFLTACGGGGGSSSTSPPGKVTDPLDPTAITLETPPTNGQLPAELLPPV